MKHSRVATERESIPMPELRTCHDVRELRACHICTRLGDRRSMIQRGTKTNGHASRHAHGRCFIKVFGMSEFLQLPRTETDKLQLDDIGVDAMKALMGRSA